MQVHNAVIRITNLRLRTFVGFNPEERVKQQDVIINVEIHHRPNVRAMNDEVEHALDYKVVSKAIISHVERGRFLLLERLVKEIADICSRDDAVTRAIVSVDKPHALRFADSVSLTLEYERQQQTSHSENRHENYPRPLSQAF